MRAREAESLWTSWSPITGCFFFFEGGVIRLSPEGAEVKEFYAPGKEKGLSRSIGSGWCNAKLGSSNSLVTSLVESPVQAYLARCLHLLRYIYQLNGVVAAVNLIYIHGSGSHSKQKTRPNDQSLAIPLTCFPT